MSNQNKISLAEVLKFIVDNRGKTVPTAEKGIALIATNCVNNSNLYPEFKNVRYITKETYDNWFRAHPEPEDILFTLKGSQNGAACLVPEIVNFVIAQDMVALRVDRKKMNPYFLLAVLRSKEIQYSIKTFDVSDVIPHFKKGDFDKLLLPYPSLDIQNLIGNIFINLEKRIELNRQMNKTLEAMAQALFKSWFVDFDPVMDNALAAGQDIPDELQAMAEKRRVLANRTVIASAAKQSASKRLINTNPELAALFPCSFEYNETLGKWIPEGWEVKKLEIISPCNKNSWTSKNAPEQVEYVDLSNTKNGDILETIIYNIEDAPSRAKRILKIGDTIFGTVRPGNRSFAYVGKGGLTGSTGFAVLSPLKKEFRAFTYLFTTQEEKIELYAHLADGAAYPAINSSVIAESLIVFSGDEILSRFEKLAGSNISKMISNKSELETLTQLRDTLLPELISGKVRVKEENFSK